MSQDDLIYYVIRKHSAPRLSITYKCKFCYAEFPGFYALRQQKNTKNGTQLGFGSSNKEVEGIVGDDYDPSLIEELDSCKHILTDTERENGRHRVFNIAMSSFDIPLVGDRMDFVSKELKCAAKVSLAFGFIQRNFERGMSRYFCAHENITILEKSKLVCTQADMTNLKINKT